MTLDSRLPIDGNKTVWRYQDLAKFVWTLSTGRLWFARTDTLEDPFEGSTTLRYLQESTASVNGTMTILIRQDINKKLRWMKQNAAVNCWHLSEDESNAMWKLYCGAGHGVAIRSTVGRLTSSLPKEVTGVGRSESAQISFDEVQYIDHYRDNVLSAYDTYGPTAPFFYKSKSFGHEKEFRALISDPLHEKKFRALISDPPTPEERSLLETTAFREKGLAVSVDLNKIIEKVYVAPTAPAWFTNTVKNLSDRFEVHFEVVPSLLDVPPPA